MPSLFPPPAARKRLFLLPRDILFCCGARDRSSHRHTHTHRFPSNFARKFRRSRTKKCLSKFPPSPSRHLSPKSQGGEKPDRKNAPLFAPLYIPLPIAIPALFSIFGNARERERKGPPPSLPIVPRKGEDPKDHSANSRKRDKKRCRETEREREGEKKGGTAKYIRRKEFNGESFLRIVLGEQRREGCLDKEKQTAAVCLTLVSLPFLNLLSTAMPFADSTMCVFCHIASYSP